VLDEIIFLAFGQRVTWLIAEMSRFSSEPIRQSAAPRRARVDGARATLRCSRQFESSRNRKRAIVIPDALQHEVMQRRSGIVQDP
jgi:hypothetical protein